MCPFGVTSNLYGIPSKHCFGVYIHANYENNTVEERYVGDTFNNEIFLQHKTPYAVGVWNGSEGSANACIYIGSEFIGKFRVGKKSSILIKRPLSVARNFTFVSQNSSTSHQSGISPNTNQGFVKVLIFPEDAFVSHAYRPAHKKPENIGHYRFSNANDQTDGFMRNKYMKSKSLDDSIYGSACSKGARPACGSSGGYMTKGYMTNKSMGFGGLPVESDGGFLTTNSARDNSDTGAIAKKSNPGITVMGDPVNQHFTPERFRLKTLGQHTFIYTLLIGDHTRNDLFMLDMDADCFVPLNEA